MPAAARIIPHRAGPSSNGPKVILLSPVIAKFSRWESAAPRPSRPLKFPLWETVGGLPGNLGMRLAKLGDYRLYLQFPQPTSGIFTFQPADGQLWIT
jgi:hypothetical protein